MSIHQQIKKRIGRPPKHPEYREYAARLDSFISWPGQYVPQTPENLATAGFYYIGSADRVTCFQCGITLRDWEEGHDPAVEHREYSPNCSFINEPDLNQLGVAPRSIPEDLQTNSVGVAGALDGLDFCVKPVDEYPAKYTSDVCIAADVDTDAVKTAKEMGFSTVEINKAREMFKQRNGRDFKNASQLVEYMLELGTTISKTERKMSQESTPHTTSTFTDSSHTSTQSDRFDDLDTVKAAKNMGFSSDQIRIAMDMFRLRNCRDKISPFELLECLLQLETIISNPEERMSQKSSHTKTNTYTDVNGATGFDPIVPMQLPENKKIRKQSVFTTTESKKPDKETCQNTLSKKGLDAYNKKPLKGVELKCSRQTDEDGLYECLHVSATFQV